jgi:hypothetical protein
MRRILIALTVLVAVGMTATAAMAAITETIRPECAPSGTHLQAGDIGCTVGEDDLTVTCTAFELAGVGNRNATETLTADYSATIDCRNPGGNIVESHETTFSNTDTNLLTPSRNGRLRVPAQEAEPNLDLAEPCPNVNWTPEFQPGTLELLSFTYSLRFVGFPTTCNYITITGP